MYEESGVEKGAAPDILALARAAQASFPKQDSLVLQQEMQVMRNEWVRKL